MKKHTPEANGSGVQPATIILLTASLDVHRYCIDHTGSRPDTEFTSLLLGGMTKAREHEPSRFAGSPFTCSPSFGPEPVVGFGGYQGMNS